MPEKDVQTLLKFMVKTSKEKKICSTNERILLKLIMRESEPENLPRSGDQWHLAEKE
jgi:hypothetical protein